MCSKNNKNAKIEVRVQSGMKIAANEKRYVVPAGMLEAARKAHLSLKERGGFFLEEILESALRWMAENDVSPTPEEAFEIYQLKKNFPFDPYEWIRWGASEWTRRMFLNTESEPPEEIKDLLFGFSELGPHYREIDSHIVEAYKRGQKSSENLA